jgi:uncharacterized protein YndB with AHSA1/START domain
MSTDIDPRDIISTRAFAIPRARIFQAWTDPALLARWWGPNGFTNTFHVFDPRPGGEWRFIMHGPNGTDYPNHSVFAEVVAPERIVFDHLSAPQFRVTATFAEQGGGTFVTFHMRFADAATCNALRALIVPSNEQNFDRLAAVLAGA